MTIAVVAMTFAAVACGNKNAKKAEAEEAPAAAEQCENKECCEKEATLEDVVKEEA